MLESAISPLLYIFCVSTATSLCILLFLFIVKCFYEVFYYLGNKVSTFFDNKKHVCIYEKCFLSVKEDYMKELEKLHEEVEELKKEKNRICEK